MANQNQVRRLQADVDSWNTWRQHHRQDRIDLSRANLSAANLSAADLSAADLSAADLSAADLSRANLNDANLSAADLSAAYLRGATLSHAYLFGANLIGADLSHAYLFDANLIGTNLRDANLSSATLSHANLRGATLSHANLRGATLSSANLRDANLRDANLFGANLRDANLNNATLNNATLSHPSLSHASLSHADLSDARMAWTTLGQLDLRNVKGLETIEHGGPSHLSINTLYTSEGDIPEAFVRGTGAPDSFIEYMHALARKPIQYYTCFISYSSKDHDFAERLYNDLQGNGVRCWFARKDLKPGDFYRDRIDESIRVYDKVLLILSEHSVKSAWVEDEVEHAWKREGEPTDPGEPVVLFPIRLDETVMHTERKWAATLRYLRHIGDFTGWKDHDAYQIHFQQLLHDLKQERPKPKP